MARSGPLKSLRRGLWRVAAEPPLRLFTRRLLALGASSLETLDRWELNPRPQYFTGVLAAAHQARSEGVPKITVAEFGVAGGAGLLALEWCASRVAAGTGVEIAVVGFDTGSGLPELCGDYRDHPDHWKPSDYPMDAAALRRRLQPGTQLVLGRVEDTIQEFLQGQPAPIGFAALDLDLYSSTAAALRIFSAANRRMLRRTFLYFDDTDFECNHRFAGELLAIDEFNADRSHDVRIDVWRGVANNRPFPEQPWLKKMWIAHDLGAITAVTLARTAVTNRCTLDR